MPWLEFPPKIQGKGLDIERETHLLLLCSLLHPACYEDQILRLQGSSSSASELPNFRDF